MSYYGSRMIAAVFNKPHGSVTRSIRELADKKKITNIIKSKFTCQQNKQNYAELFINSNSLVILTKYWESKKPKRIKKSKLTKAKKEAVKSRDGFTCQNCGTKKDLCVDHKIPESRGGNNSMDNLHTLCRPCNSRKGVKTMKEWQGVLQ